MKVSLHEINLTLDSFDFSDTDQKDMLRFISEMDEYVAERDFTDKLLKRLIKTNIDDGIDETIEFLYKEIGKYTEGGAGNETPTEKVQRLTRELQEATEEL
jgi:hypothetical protein